MYTFSNAFLFETEYNFFGSMIFFNNFAILF